MVFLGTVRMQKDSSKTIQEVFLAKVPTDEALEQKDTMTSMELERITFLEETNNPGVQGPRHWLIGDGSGRRVYFLVKDSMSIVQLACVDVLEKQTSILTELKESIEGQISCDPKGKRISFVSGGKVHLLDLSTGETEIWTEHRWEDQRGLAVVCPPFQGSYVGSVHFVDEARLLVNRYVGTPNERFLQILQLQAD
jgi:putative component of toxin-antitoxin plasmid stabilization module